MLNIQADSKNGRKVWGGNLYSILLSVILVKEQSIVQICTISFYICHGPQNRPVMPEMMFTTLSVLTWYVEVL